MSGGETVNSLRSTPGEAHDETADTWVLVKDWRSRPSTQDMCKHAERGVTGLKGGGLYLELLEVISLKPPAMPLPPGLRKTVLAGSSTESSYALGPATVLRIGYKPLRKGM